MQIGLGIGIPFTKSQVWLAVQAVFTPAKLFDSGANGLWLDPGDLTTMFQDSTGTTPVTAVEQPVGLILDKSKGLVLGPELVTNGNFSNGTTGWSGQANVTISTENGELKGVTSSSSSTFAYQDEVTVSGKWYKATATLRCASGDMRLEIYNGAFATKLAGAILTTPTANTQISIYFVATGTSTRISFGTTTSAATTYYADNISVRELSGNHAFQSTSANRPTLSARYNLLTKTEQFDDAAWTKQSGTVISPTKVTAPDGSLTAFSIVGNGTSGILQAVAGSVSLGETTRAVYLRVTAGTATVGIKDPARTQGTTTCNLTTVWQRFSLTETTAPSAGFAGGIWVFNIPATGIEMAWPDFRSSNQSSLPYQRVNTATDYDSDQTKFPWYLKFNGTSSSMQSASINFTATDKMFVSAGVRRNSAHDGLIVENSVASWQYSGAFGLGSIAAGGFFTGLSGTTKGGFGTYAKTAPSTDVATAIFDISSVAQADESKLRINTIGVVQNFVSPAAGTGNFSNYPLYIGARGGTSLFFNGYLYQLVIAGKQASAEEIDSTENYIELKTFGKDMSYVYDYLVDSTGNQITDSAGNPIYVTTTYQ